MDDNDDGNMDNLQSIEQDAKYIRRWFYFIVLIPILACITGVLVAIVILINKFNIHF